MGSNLQPEQILGSFQRLLQIYPISGSDHVLNGTGSFVDLNISGSISASGTVTANSGSFNYLTVNGSQVTSGSITITSGTLSLDDLEDREIVFVTGSTLSGSGAFKWNYDTNTMSITGSVHVSGALEWKYTTNTSQLEQILSTGGGGRAIWRITSDGDYNDHYFYIAENPTLNQGGLFAAQDTYAFFVSGTNGHVQSLRINTSTNTGLTSLYDPVKGNEAFRGHVSYSSLGWQQDLAIYSILIDDSDTWNLGPKGGESGMGAIIVSDNSVIRSSSLGGNTIISTDTGVISNGLAYTSILSGRNITATANSSSYLNRLIFQSEDNTFDGTLEPTTLTAARTYTLQDGSGTIAFIDDANAQMTGSFSGSFVGDGSGLTGIASSSLSNVVFTNLGLTAEQTVQGTLRLTGNIVAENYIISSSVTYMTSSFSSGSTIFGDTLDDTHQFTGSLYVTGSVLDVSNDVIIRGNNTEGTQLLHSYVTLLSSTGGGTFDYVVSVPHATYDSAFFEYYVQSGSSARRAGTVMAVWEEGGAQVEYTEVTTNDIGSTLEVTMSVQSDGPNVNLAIQTQNAGWTVRTNYRAM